MVKHSKIAQLLFNGNEQRTTLNYRVGTQFFSYAFQQTLKRAGFNGHNINILKISCFFSRNYYSMLYLRSVSHRHTLNILITCNSVIIGAI